MVPNFCMSPVLNLEAEQKAPNISGIEIACLKEVADLKVSAKSEVTHPLKDFVTWEMRKKTHGEF